MSSIVIVGGGHAGGQAAASLRHAGFDGALTIVGNEPHPPYQRPPLSKQYLAGEVDLAHLYVRQPDFFEKLNGVTPSRRARHLYAQRVLRLKRHRSGSNRKK